MAGYFQIDRCVFSSSVWIAGTSDERVLWIWLLGNCEDDGVVRHREIAIADGAKLPRDVVEAALEKFASPDPDSRTRDHDGRRIDRTPDGFVRILNHEIYYSKDYSTPRWRKWRDRKRANALANGQTPLATKDKDKDKDKDKERSQAQDPSRNSPKVPISRSEGTHERTRESPPPARMQPDGSIVVSEDFEADLRARYPELDVPAALRTASTWHRLQPPSARKKKLERFLENWLQRDLAKLKFRGNGGSKAAERRARTDDALRQVMREVLEEEALQIESPVYPDITARHQKREEERLAREKAARDEKPPPGMTARQTREWYEKRGVQPWAR